MRWSTLKEDHPLLRVSPHRRAIALGRLHSDNGEGKTNQLSCVGPAESNTFIEYVAAGRELTDDGRGMSIDHRTALMVERCIMKRNKS